MYENNESEEECPKGSNRRKFSPSHGSPLYVLGPRRSILDAFRWSAHRQQHGSLISVPVNNDYSAHAHYNEFVFVPALAFNRMNLAIMQSGPK
jgi:hypothetical protein